MKKKLRELPVPGVEIYVREDIEIELQLMLMAAAKAYVNGLKSVDRLLKRYGDFWRRQIEAERKSPTSGICQ